MQITDKPYAESCDQNREPILKVIEPVLSKAQTVLEVGSGTGQHAIAFATVMPQLRWQTSDVRENHAGIRLWLEEAKLANVLPPLALNVVSDGWPSERYDAVFSANTVHIMHWPMVEAMFAGIGTVLNEGGDFLLYGPFNYGGKFTSDSNARFDDWLKGRDPESGIRHFEELDALANKAEMQLFQDYEMPANNRILHWKKSSTREKV